MRSAAEWALHLMATGANAVNEDQLTSVLIDGVAKIQAEARRAALDEARKALQRVRLGAGRHVHGFLERSIGHEAGVEECQEALRALAAKERP